MGCRELQVNDYFRMTDSVSGTDVAYYALADANKNITEYFDSNGNVVAHYEYSPFGKITKKSGTMQNDFDVCTLAINSHGNSDNMNFGEQGHLYAGEEGIYYEDGEGGMTDITSLFSDHLENSDIYLNGCHTGAGENSIAEHISEHVPSSTVYGASSFQFDVPFTANSLGNQNIFVDGENTGSTW
jgi:hypothetical protein